MRGPFARRSARALVDRVSTRRSGELSRTGVAFEMGTAHGPAIAPGVSGISLAVADDVDARWSR